MKICELCRELDGKPAAAKPHSSLLLHHGTAADVRGESPLKRWNYHCSDCDTEMWRSVDGGDFVGNWRAVNN